MRFRKKKWFGKRVKTRFGIGLKRGKRRKRYHISRGGIRF